MDFNIHYLIMGMAVVTMLYALWQVFALKKHIPGGVVGKSWKSLAILVALFAVGYLAMPFMGRLPPDELYLIVGIIFLFGAIYVVMTISLIKRIILTLTE